MWMLVPLAFVTGARFLDSTRFDRRQRVANFVGLFLVFGSPMLVLRPLPPVAVTNPQSFRVLLILCSSLAAIGLALLALTRINS